MGDRAALDGMARAPPAARRDVVPADGGHAPLRPSPTSPSASAAWLPDAPADGAEPLGFNLEGPFLADARRGAHDPAHLRAPGRRRRTTSSRSSTGSASLTIAPELPGALELIGWLRERGVAVSIGHSAADHRRGARRVCGRWPLHDPPVQRDERRRPSRARSRPRGADRRRGLRRAHRRRRPRPPRAVAAHRPAKPADRLLLVSDAISLAGMGDGAGRIGGLEVEVVDGRVDAAGTTTLAGSVIALDDAVRNLVASGIALAGRVAAASANPLGFSASPTAAGSRPASAPTSSSSTMTLRVRRVMRVGGCGVGLTRLTDRRAVRPGRRPESHDAAASLLAARHRAQRLSRAALDARFEDPAATRVEIESPRGLVGRVGFGRPAGRRRRRLSARGAAGAALGSEHVGRGRRPRGRPRPGVVRDLYGVPPPAGSKAGATSHYVLVPASDPAVVDAWFRVGFGDAARARDPRGAAARPDVRGPTRR